MAFKVSVISLALFDRGDGDLKQSTIVASGMPKPRVECVMRAHRRGVLTSKRLGNDSPAVVNESRIRV